MLLVKLADRLDNLESLRVFSPRQAGAHRPGERADVRQHLPPPVHDGPGRPTHPKRSGQFLIARSRSSFRAAQASSGGAGRAPSRHLRSRLAEIFPGDLGARIEMRWNRFNPDLPADARKPLHRPHHHRSREDAYRALGRVHLAFRAIPGTFSDTVTAPRKNGFRALETRVATGAHPALLHRQPRGGPLQPVGAPVHGHREPSVQPGVPRRPAGIPAERADGTSRTSCDSSFPTPSR